MPEGIHLLIVAGDPSADAHGEALVLALRKREPSVRVTALGGPRLMRVANRFLYSLVSVGGFGFLEPIAKIPQLWRIKRMIERVLQEDPPTLVIPMDYYGFNIHVAEAAKARGLRVVYYISPQVWASRPHRIARLAKAVHRMLVILPFEKALYEDAGVPVTYVGHPLLERLPAPEMPRQPPIVGLLPGSRRSVVLRHLPILIETADRIHSTAPQTSFRLFRSENLPDDIFTPFVPVRPWLRLVVDPHYEERRLLTLAIGVSGTAALENTFLGIPMIIMYRLSTVTYWIARHLIRIPYIGMPNILAGKIVVPEFVQKDASAERLTEEALSLLGNASKRAVMRDDLLALRAHLASGGSDRAADEVLKEAAMARGAR